MINLGAAVDERVWLAESLLTTTYTDPPGELPDDEPTAPAEWLGWGDFPWGGLAFGAGTSGAVPPFEFKVATVDWYTRTDDPDRPAQYWEGRLISAGDFTRSISLTPVGESAVEVSTGTMTFDNTDGAYDSVLDDFEAVSQQVAIKRAVADEFWSSYETVWLMRITGVNLSDREVTLELQEPLAYAQNFFPVSYYGGTGGADGDAGLAGVQKPVVFGRVYNMAPALVYAAGLIYQLHDGTVAAVGGVFDGGAALTYSGTNVADYAALAAATVPAGKYTTCLALGLIKLGSSPAKQITASFDGLSAAGTSVRSIALWLAGQLATQIWSEVDTAAFTATLPTWTAGWVWTEPFTYQEALSRFIGDGGCVWGTLQPGPITVAKLLAPTLETGGGSDGSGDFDGDDFEGTDFSAGDVGLVRSFDESDILRLERVSLPSGYESTHLRRIIRYGRNWTVQPQSDQVALAVDPAYRTQEWKQAVSTSSIAARNALDPPVLDTSLQVAADASSLANHLIQLHGVRRRLYSLTTKMLGLMPPLTSTVIVTYSRLGLGGGVPLRVLSIEQDFKQNEMTLLLWG